MTLRRVTAPAVEPVSLAEAKLQRRVEHALDDAWFTGIAIPSARQTAENITGRALVTQTWELALDAFPGCEIELAKPKVLSIVSVKYLDEDGIEQTVNPSQYTLDADTQPGWLLLADGASWPGTQDGANAVRVRFTAGYGPAAADVPANIRQWMLMQIATAHKHRESFASGISITDLPNRFVDGLLDEARTYL